MAHTAMPMASATNIVLVMILLPCILETPLSRVQSPNLKSTPPGPKWFVPAAPCHSRRWGPENPSIGYLAGLCVKRLLLGSHRRLEEEPVPGPHASSSRNGPPCVIPNVPSHRKACDPLVADLPTTPVKSTSVFGAGGIWRQVVKTNPALLHCHRSPSATLLVAGRGAANTKRTAAQATRFAITSTRTLRIRREPFAVAPFERNGGARHRSSS
ncbi:hypothetical protein ACVWY5_001578 [Bradyrhizobium sp. USDA 3256]